ncbi:hypothetical protein AsAng_0003870 [Aureispira anguillae]|uniref:Lipoprotein n=1 Tax=Aureispira anguillae TaxID=2864201 RepID=A0A915Y9P9_9BACT|nr:hypothetical protein AsAng_0003870 [Aureispira anguillae]
MVATLLAALLVSSCNPVGALHQAGTTAFMWFLLFEQKGQKIVLC